MTYRHFRSLAFGLILLLSLRASPALAEPVWRIGVGEQRLFAAPPGLVSFTVIGDAVTARRPPRDPDGPLLLRANRAGTARVLLRVRGEVQPRPVEIEISPPAPGPALPAGLIRGLSRLTLASPLEAWTDAEGWTIRGTARARTDWDTVQRLVRDFPKRVRAEVELDAKLARELRTELEGWLSREYPSEELAVAAEPSGLRISGGVRDPRTLTRLTRTLPARFPGVELGGVDALSRRPQVIHFQIYLLEARRGSMRALGLEWPGRADNALSLRGDRGWPLLSDHLPIDLHLRAQETAGSVRILSNPELVVRSPGEAELFAGGEIPVPLKGPRSSQILWKNHGLTLRLKVLETVGRWVRTEVFTETSALDPATGADGVPGLRSNRMRTSIEAEIGRPVLLSGLLQEGWKRAAQGLPFLRSLPILGSLFGSEDFQQDRSEFVVLLLPKTAGERAPQPREWPGAPGVDLESQAPESPETALGEDAASGVLALSHAL